ncbi:MAG: hypothetical protein LLG05_05255 [Porphyromonadaceae bacterium]|nr:hypothetical protein [Porphyromonadaceae bacterium]
MTKREALSYMEEKRKEGYLTHSLILEIYNDNDEIPDDILDLVCHLPEPPKNIIIFGSAAMINEFNKAVEGYSMAMEQKNISDELCKDISEQ